MMKKKVGSKGKSNLSNHDFSNKTVMIMLILVIIITIASILLSLQAENIDAKDDSNKPSPQTSTYGKVTLQIIEPPEEIERAEGGLN